MSMRILLFYTTFYSFVFLVKVIYREKLIDMLLHLNIPQLRQIFIEYDSRYNSSVESAIEELFSGNSYEDLRPALLAISKQYIFSSTF